MPLKMDLTEGSETLAKLNLMPWRHPIEHIHDSEHGENLKSRIMYTCVNNIKIVIKKLAWWYGLD
jgi:hypothetical protein